MAAIARKRRRRMRRRSTHCVTGSAPMGDLAEGRRTPCDIISHSAARRAGCRYRRAYSRNSAADGAQDAPRTAAAAAAPCSGDNGGITLPPGFCATVFADNIGHARQMVVTPNGVLYVNSWSGTYYRNDTPPPGGFLLALQDTTGDGRADVVVRFGPDAKSGNAGGTGIAL
jgi:hypothetical protein